MATEFVTADDGLPAEVVGPWAKEKHKYLCSYLDASRGARKGFLGTGKAGATFVDLFCAFGRANIRDTPQFIPGSAVAAWQTSAGGSAPFSRIFIGDIDPERRAACFERLARLSAPVTELDGSALAAAMEYRRSVRPDGLHLAFLDPHGLGTLDFEIIRELSLLQRVDMLIHVSVMDMQRNLLGQLSDEEAFEFDTFAPGWRSKIDTKGPQKEVRQRLLHYWGGLVQSLGMKPFTDSRLIRGRTGQRLYWLMLASRSELAQSLWKKIGRADRQKEMF